MHTYKLKRIMQPFIVEKKMDSEVGSEARNSVASRVRTIPTCSSKKKARKGKKRFS